MRLTEILIIIVTKRMMMLKLMITLISQAINVDKIIWKFNNARISK